MNSQQSAAYGPLVFLAHWMILVNEGLADVELEHLMDSIDLGCNLLHDESLMIGAGKPLGVKKTA